MTLLELLLALTIMASVMALLGALMAQAHGWTDRSVEDEALMRLQRVGEALRTQWADRRSAVNLDDNGGKVLTSSTELQFVTATGLLFPNWPLVEATYRIEPDTAHVSSGGLLWRLVYEETRISGMDAPPGEYALDAQGRSMRDSMVLLDRCTELRWDRFGQAKAAELQTQETETSGSTAASDTGARADDGAGGTEGSTDGSQDDQKPKPAPTSGAATEDRQDVSQDDLQFRWRPMEERHTGVVPAVRLVGSRNGERFGWVFVIRALR